MSQVDTQQTRPQSGRQQTNSPVGNGRGGPKRQGTGRNFDGNQQRNGGDRSAGRGRGAPRGDRPFNNKDSKTIYIGKVFTDDLDGSALSDKLKDQRIKYLREALDQFGPIDSFDAPSGEGYVLLSYETHQAADSALKTLKNADQVDSILARIKDKINTSKLPLAVTPNLHKYRYSWSDKPAPSRNAPRGKNAPQMPKTVVASTKKTTDQTTSSPSTPQTQPQQQQQSAPQTQQQQTQPKPKKERKPKQEEQTQEQPTQQQAQPSQPTQTQQQQPKQKKSQQQQAVQQQQQSALSPKTQQGADDLQREAERARLSQDMVYLHQQQQHVSQELSAESDRCRARDERINRLSEELNRVRQQEQFLEGQLKAEQKWKTDAEERIAKLTEEINHFAQEEKQVEKRLRTVELQLNGH